MNPTTQDHHSGFRLQYMEVLNWGTFNEKVWRIVPDGNNSLLTGSIGSGKSTLVDALTCLLVPHHRITFNKAASAENKERSLLSYVKGYYKHEKDELNLKEKAVSLRYKTEGEATFSIILANFNNEGYKQDITLAQIFWVQNDKVQKMLLIAKKPLTIKGYFENIGDVHELKKRLKSDPQIEVFDDNFTQYSQQFRRYFSMGEKAVDLFCQTVSMKSVSSLTAFVREQMLEKTDVKQQIEELKKRFSDLSRTHERVASLRRQKETLDPLTELEQERVSIEEKIEEIYNILQAIPSFFATKKYDLLEKEMISCQAKLEKLENQKSLLFKELDEKRENELSLRQNIRNNGGDRLEEIEKLIRGKESSKDEKQKKYNSYNTLTTVCDLPTANVEKTFYSNLQKANEQLPKLQQEQERLEELKVNQTVRERELGEAIQKDELELQSLLKRKTQIPNEILNIRQQIIDDLEIPESEIPFVGELLKVRDQDKEWEGAIERLLHGFGLSMIVPEKHYKQVSKYVNSRSLQVQSTNANGKKNGQRLDFYKVPVELKYRLQGEIDPDSIINKIEIKPDCNYVDWLENELTRRFDLRGVSFEEYQKQKDVITIEGLFKIGEFRNTKDDRRELWDRRNFVLGWSNVEKIKAIQQAVAQLQRNKDKVSEQLKSTKTELGNNKTLQGKVEQLLLYKDWSEINWQDESKAIEKLKQEKYDLQTSNNVLATLQKQLDDLLLEIQGINQRLTDKSEEIGGEKDRIKGYQEQKTHTQQQKELILQHDADMFYPKIEELLVGQDLTIKNIDGIASTLSKQFSERNGKKDQLQGRLRYVENKMTTQMKDYKDKFPSESTELTVDIESTAEYLKKLSEIIQQDLPKHEKRLKEMLNENTIHDIAAFDNKLEIHYKDIKDKISKINEHVRSIEYNKGTYICLEDDRNPDREILDFKNDLKACYSGIMGSDDAYIEERFNKVKLLLDKFNSQKDLDIKWTDKVTDVRNWFLFNARERYQADHSPKEFYSGAGGKSGGQKEKLAYTILASALAYQFGLSYGDSLSKSFRFVVIDEAFGRGDDESTQFGLGLFKKLDLQLLIVTPLQKIHIIENHVNAVHYVSNPDGNNSEIQNLTVEEYRMEKLKKELIATK
ncbi:MAG: AAA family ATPase [Bacteroidia bacterium]|jgi:uncharacterized protein YPO0396|nr:AAA family ATPase [Bacteroidia bacterium]